MTDNKINSSVNNKRIAKNTMYLYLRMFVTILVSLYTVRIVLAALGEVGDSILTTSGFYGMVIDVQDDMVIVEFGNNKNCRIPMQKTAIVDVEKADAE